MNCIGRMLWGCLTTALQLLELSCSLSDCLWVLAEHRENSLHALSTLWGCGKFRSPWDWGWVKLTFPILGGKSCNSGSRFHLHSWGNGCCRCGWSEMAEGARRCLESRWTYLLPIFSWLTGIGGLRFWDAFLCTQPGNAEGPASLGAPTPTPHLWVMGSAALYRHGFPDPSSGFLLEKGLTGGAKDQ